MRNRYIGLLAEDTPDLVTGFLAILKSGDTVVPLNPLFPEERLQFIIRDCGIDVLLTDTFNIEKARRLAGGCDVIRHVLCLDETVVDDSGEEPVQREEKPLVPVSPVEPVYVIYTSGSTGLPKGVMIHHRNLVPLLQWFMDYFGLGEHTSVLHNLSYTFDFGVFELLSTVMCGGTLYMMDVESKGDFKRSLECIHSHEINTLHTTPAFFMGLAGLGREMPSLKLLHMGGEKLTGEMIAQAAAQLPPDCVIYNGYGPTETTINSAIFRITPELRESVVQWENIPIGKPSALHQLTILDQHNNLQPIGVAGELCISGEGVAPGYINRPELTAERFNKKFLGVQNPFFKKGFGRRRQYRTGDLVRWLLDGNIEFLGRIDHQVKIRGYRIELGEIENRLLRHEDIEEAVVLARQDEGRGHAYLCAYIVLGEDVDRSSFTLAGLREYMLGELPDYMAPSYVVRMERMPLTANGKVDRGALPEPDESVRASGAPYEAPRGEIERRMVRIWQDVLHIEAIGTRDDFFELGGDSILANQCMARVREEFKVELPLRRFFESPFIRALAGEVSEGRPHVERIGKAPEDVDIPLSFAQERLWFLQKLDKHSLAYFVPRVIRMHGTLDPVLLERTFTEIIRRHEILRTVFPTKQGKPLQRVLEAQRLDMPLLDFSGLEKAEREAEAWSWIAEEGRRSFDFEQGPLLRVTLLKMSNREHIVVLTEHHLVHDGWTQGVLLKEFIAIFSAYLEGREPSLPELPIQYADFAYWQRRRFKGELLESHLSYWKQKLSGLPPYLELPADHPRPPLISNRGGMIEFLAPASLTAALKEFGKEEGVTLFMTMMAVFKVFIYRYSGAEDLCVGTGAASRGIKEMEGMLGMVINTLAMRTRISPDLSFREFLHRVKETCIEGYEYEDTPFDKVVDAVNPERSLQYTPLFQVMFAFMDTPTEALALPGLELILEPSHNRSAKFDISVVVVPPAEPGPGEEQGEILVEWEYNSDIFEESTIRRMTDVYLVLLEESISRAGEKVAALHLVKNEPIPAAVAPVVETSVPGEAAEEEMMAETVGIELVVPARRAYIKDLDVLPVPDRSLVDYEKYHQHIGMALARHTMTLQATRGCPYRCAYCHKLWPKAHVFRSAEHILSEVKALYDVGVRRFVFIDDIFNLNIANSTRFFELIVKRGLKVQVFFPNGLRGDVLTPELMDLMVEAGTVDFDFSLESASPRIQKLVQKNLKLDRFRENIQYLIRRHPGVILEVQTMLGFPTETEEEAMMTFDFIKSIQWIDFPYVHLLKIYPGTDMEKVAIENGVSREAIARTADLAYHEYAATMPFPEEFVKLYQARFFNEYFLSKERFKQVLPRQLGIVSRNELAQKYDSFFPSRVESFSQLLDIVGIDEADLGHIEGRGEMEFAAPSLNRSLGEMSGASSPSPDALRVLLLDLSLYFSGQGDGVYNVKEVPLGLMYLATYAHRQFGDRVHCKIAKSGMDFDSYEELKALLPEYNPHLIGIRTLSFYKEFFHEVVYSLRQWGVETPVITGGPYASSAYKEILQDRHVDLVVFGEGESTFAELIGKMLEKDKTFPDDDVLEGIQGIAFARNRRKSVEHSMQREQEKKENLKVEFNF
jgi:amino acid adenylation domain-containing protein